jgi:hypothetical protein
MKFVENPILTPLNERAPRSENARTNVQLIQYITGLSDWVEVMLPTLDIRMTSPEYYKN